MREHRAERRQDEQPNRLTIGWLELPDRRVEIGRPVGLEKKIDF